MATLSASEVRIGTLDQTSTIGAVLVAPVGTAMPALADMAATGVTINSAFAGLGYLQADGFDVNFDMSTEGIKEHNQGLVRYVVSESGHQITLTFIQTNDAIFSEMVGADYLTTAAADLTHGNRFKASFGAHLPDPRAWIIKLKDGDSRGLIEVPRGQVTSIGTTKVAATDALKWQIVVKCLDDGTGNDMYFLSDDGVTSE